MTLLVRAKAPLRISFAGGGTAVSPFPETEGGWVLSSTINRYAWGTLRPRTDGQIFINSLDFGLSLSYGSREQLVYDDQMDLPKAVQLGEIYACPHDVGVCDCRKPQVGLFRQAQREHPWIDFAAADLVGDSLGDLEAGHRLDIRLWLVGENVRRREISQTAREQDIPLACEAGSLLALVEDGRLLQSIGQRNA